MRARIGAIFPLILSLVGLVALGCSKEEAASKSADQSHEAVAVTLAPVRVESMDRTVEVVGTLYGDEQATISAKVPGRIKSYVVDVGDRVDFSQPLGEVDPTDYQLAVDQRRGALREALAKLGMSELPAEDFDVSKIATVERAKFQTANAKAKLDRADQLFKSQPPLISEQDYADLQTAHEVARRDYDVAQLEAKTQLALAQTRQSELQAAMQRLEDCVIRAPNSGAVQQPESAAAINSDDRGIPPLAVMQRDVAVGEYVREGDPLFELVADAPIRFRAAVPERFIAQLKTDQPAQVRVEGYDQPFEGKVSRINPAIDVQSRTFEIEMLVPNAERQLRPGAFARGLVVTGKIPEVRLVPRQAVASFAGVDRVYSVKDGKAIEHVVTLGSILGDHVAVIEGLTDQREVVVTGQHQLSKDAPVTLKAPSPTTAPATETKS